MVINSSGSTFFYSEVDYASTLRRVKYDGLGRFRIIENKFKDRE